MAGRRALAVEVQALVVPTQGPARRHVDGLNGRRFHIVAAVTDRAADLGLGRAELYGSVGGGVRLEDPGADLAVAIALASAATGRVPPTGDHVRRRGVPDRGRSARRGHGATASAAAAAGVRTVVCAECPERAAGPPFGTAVAQCGSGHVRNAVTTLVGSGNEPGFRRATVSGQYGR